MPVPADTDEIIISDYITVVNTSPDFKVVPNPDYPKEEWAKYLAALKKAQEARWPNRPLALGMRVVPWGEEGEWPGADSGHHTNWFSYAAGGWLAHNAAIDGQPTLILAYGGDWSNNPGAGYSVAVRLLKLAAAGEDFYTTANPPEDLYNEIVRPMYDAGRYPFLLQLSP
jgi:hypothetical protein